MKKFLAVLALVGVMTSCKDKKKDEKKPEETTTTTTTDPTTTTTTTTDANVPTFSDPEVQKFVTEYSAFITEYKAGMTDPAKAQALAKTAQEWSGKMSNIGMKLASNPDDLKKWTEWAQWVAAQFTPATK
ncbi:MAG: hypothetical protein V9F01_07310 [Chitinophagaceae bacterium]